MAALEDEPDEPTAFLNRPSAAPQREPAPAVLPAEADPPPKQVELHSQPTAILSRPVELRSLSAKPSAIPLPPVIVAAHATPPPREPLVSDPFADARARRAKRWRSAAIGTGGALALFAVGYLLGRARTPAGSAAPQVAADAVAKPSSEPAESAARSAAGAREPSATAPGADERAEEPPPETARKPTRSSPPSSHRGSSASAHTGAAGEPHTSETPIARDAAPRAEAHAAPPRTPPVATDKGFISPIRSPGF